MSSPRSRFGFFRVGLDKGQHLHLEHLVDPAELRDGLGMFVHAEVHVGVGLVLYRAYRSALLSPPVPADLLQWWYALRSASVSLVEKKQ